MAGFFVLIKRVEKIINELTAICPDGIPNSSFAAPPLLRALQFIALAGLGSFINCFRIIEPTITTNRTTDTIMYFIVLLGDTIAPINGNVVVAILVSDKKLAS